MKTMVEVFFSIMLCTPKTQSATYDQTNDVTILCIKMLYRTGLPCILFTLTYSFLLKFTLYYYVGVLKRMV